MSDSHMDDTVLPALEEPDPFYYRKGPCEDLLGRSAKPGCAYALGRLLLFRTQYSRKNNSAGRTAPAQCVWSGKAPWIIRPANGVIAISSLKASWRNGMLLLTLHTGGDRAFEKAAFQAALERQVEGIIFATM